MSTGRKTVSNRGIGCRGKAVGDFDGLAHAGFGKEGVSDWRCEPRQGAGLRQRYAILTEGVSMPVEEGPSEAEVRRRSDRVSLTLLLETSGKDANGNEFKLSSRTLLINRSGAVIVLE